MKIGSAMKGVKRTSLALICDGILWKEFYFLKSKNPLQTNADNREMPYKCYHKKMKDEMHWALLWFLRNSFLSSKMLSNCRRIDWILEEIPELLVYKKIYQNWCLTRKNPSFQRKIYKCNWIIFSKSNDKMEWKWMEKKPPREHLFLFHFSTARGISFSGQQAEKGCGVVIFSSKWISLHIHIQSSWTKSVPGQ